MAFHLKNLLLLCCLGSFLELGGSVSRENVLQYFSSISGIKTLAGQYNDPISNPSLSTNFVQNVTGFFPGLWSNNFYYSAPHIEYRQTITNEAIRQWNAGTIVHLYWTVCPPTVAEPCLYQDTARGFTEDQWSSLLQDGSDLNTKLKQRFSIITPYLHQLQDAGVIVVLTPFPRINDAERWWGGRKGSSGSRRLFQIFREYFQPKFNNLIWNWNVRALNINSIGDFWPGSDYVDIASLGTDHGDMAGELDPLFTHYQKMQEVSQGKPIALSLVRGVPTPPALEQQPGWLWFMVSGPLINDPSVNPVERIQNTYYLPRTITQGQFNFGGRGDNLTLNKTLVASSEENPTLGAQNANDGNLSTRWSSDQSNSQWIDVDLEVARSISRVVLIWDATYAKGYRIQTSDDGATWVTQYEELSGDGDSDEIVLPQSVTTRYVRLLTLVKGTLFRYAVKEFEIYA